jgi:Ulp1 family protease
MDKVNSIIEAIRTHSLLGPDDFEALLQCRDIGELHGFPPECDFDVANFTSLHELLGENWIGECVLDTRAYQVMAELKSKNDCPSVLILPTIFHTQLSNAYRDNRLSKHLKDLRDSLLADLPAFIAFIFNKRHCHWAPCIISTTELLVQQGDSLRWAPDESMLAMLRWFLGDVTEIQGTWKEKELPVPYQGPKSGSCGIIALNVIHTFIDHDAMPWCLERSSTFRHSWLRALLLHHLAAVQAEEKAVSFFLFNHSEH